MRTRDEIKYTMQQSISQIAQLAAKANPNPMQVYDAQNSVVASILTGILEASLDIRDQNALLIELLQNQSVQMRAVALEAYADVIKKVGVDA